jgi:hypothetical protein
MKHTELPWEVAHYEDGILEGVNFIRSTANPHPICTIINGGELPEVVAANAAFIVRACNSHYELLEACKAMLDQLSLGRDLSEGAYADMLTRARAAIAKGTT